MEQISLRFQHKLTTRTTLHEEGTAPDLKTTYPALFTKSGTLLFKFGCEELRVGFAFALLRRGVRQPRHPLGQQMTVRGDEEPGSGGRPRRAARDVIDLGGASVESRGEQQHNPADHHHMHHRHLKQAELEMIQEKPARQVLPSREAKHLLTAKDKAKKQQEAKQRLLDAELACCTFTPKLCAKSKKMAEKKLGDAIGWDNHLRSTVALMAKKSGCLKRSSLTPSLNLPHFLQKSLNACAESDARTCSTPQSKTTRCLVKHMQHSGRLSGPVEDRLMEAAHRKKERLALAERAAALEELGHMSVFSKSTQALDLSPSIALTKETSQRAMAASQRLYEQAFERENKIFRLHCALQQERTQLSKKSQVLPNSREIVERRRSLSAERAPEEAFERLSRPVRRPIYIGDAKSSDPNPALAEKSQGKDSSADVVPVTSKPLDTSGDRLTNLSQPRIRNTGAQLNVSLEDLPMFARAGGCVDHVGAWPCGIPERPRAGPAFEPSSLSSPSLPSHTAEEAKTKTRQGGVGIQLTAQEDGSFVIEDVPAGGPAATSGRIKPGDQLTAVDGVKIGGRDMPFVAARITGVPSRAI